MQDTVLQIRDLLKQHHQLFDDGICLIASENVTSPMVREAICTDLANRYAEGWVGQRVYAGCNYLDQIEQICMDLAKRYYRCDFADVRPISGVVANLAMYVALTTPKGKMCCMPIPKGGHISHAPMYGKSGNEINGTAGAVRGLDIEYLAFDEPEMNLDIDGSAKVIREFQPELLLFGGSVFLFPHPVKELSEVAREVGAHVAYDGAHVAGLIGSGYFQDPLHEGAEVMTMSTHKTLPGPQHGMVLASGDDEALFEKLKKAAFPSLLSNHHLHNVAGLAITLAEMIEFGQEYHGQVIKNAKALGQALYERGFNVLCEHKGFTESHQIVVDITNFQDTIGLGGDIERLLERANIIINRNMLPSDVRDGRDYHNPGGLRLGTSELTRLGMRESEMEQVAEFFKRVVIDQQDPDVVKEDLRAFKQDYREVQYCFPSKLKAYEYVEIA
ncbi:MAG TPA: serine hydroxymethyltransferase [Candidatus Lokiarchaeia archaeon]|nr:serine hydroxymethyltransferase [Candidatus Lokiarchaeia archaeon]